MKAVGGSRAARYTSPRVTASRPAARAAAGRTAAAPCGGTDRRTGCTPCGSARRAPCRSRPARAPGARTTTAPGALRPPCRATWIPLPALPPIVFDASASRRRAARSCDDSGFASFSETKLSSRATSFSIRWRLAFDVQLAALERVRVRRQHALHRAHEAPAERIRALADRRRGLVPPRAQRAHLLEQIRRGDRLGPLGREERLELDRERLAVGLARLDLDLVAALVAVEERVRGRPEPLPQRLRLGPADRADRLPVRLQPAQLGRRLVPVARGRRAPRRGRTALPSCAWLAPQTSLRCARSSFRRVKNLSHASRNRFQTTRVSGRGTGPGRLPLRLELLHLLGGLDPVGGLGERLGARRRGRASP